MSDYRLHLADIGELPLLSWHADGENVVATLTDEGGKVPQLFQYAQDGRLIESGGIEGSGGQVAFKNVYLTSLTASGGGDHPAYTLSFSVDEMRYL